MSTPVLLWFRRDLRLADNPALQAALGANKPIIPFYLLDESAGVRPPGAAALWWLDKSLTALGAALEERGSRLVLRRGEAGEAISALADETGASAVFWNGLFDPGLPVSEGRVAERLAERGVEARRFNGAYLVQPEAVRTKTGNAFSVFTPFWRTARQMVAPGEAQPPPAALPAPAAWPASDGLADWGLHPRAPDWSGGFSDWTPGEAGAQQRLRTFVEGPLATYATDRDRPDREGVSRLSPHLHFGEVSPKACWRAARTAVAEDQSDKFLAELGWREFNAAISSRGRDLAQENFDVRFDHFPWRADPAGLEAWKRGRTGYPIVDAGMRQLWATGWMHNRVRMIAASFLTKHLMIDWREGEAWFWDALVDADHASNAGNWQWVAGSGADASPYFRIFNPMIQGEKFDPDGAYVRRWVPELARLSAKIIHTPWRADRAMLSACGVTLGVTYPQPIVEHEAARGRALEAYQQMKARADGVD